MKTRFAKVLVLLAVIMAMVTMMAIPALAAKTVTVLDGNVSVTDSIGNGTVSNNVVTINATGTTFGGKDNEVTITNESQDNAKLSFDWAVKNAKSYDINGATGNAGLVETVDGNGVCSVRLNAGETIKITFKPQAKSFGAATLTLSNFTFERIGDSANVSFVFDSAEGTVTVGGTSWTSGDTIEVNPEEGVAVVATAKSGYTFVGWVNTETGRVYSMKANDTVTPTTDASIRAVFATSAPTFYVKNQGYNYFYNNWSDAATAAVNSDTKVMVLANNATLSAGEYTVPAGVTLLIPYDAGHTNVMDTPVSVETWEKPTQYRTLTMANGASITVNGALCVGGQQSAKYQYNGMPTGPVGFIKMNTGSSISVQSGANLYAWGYITGSGSVAVKAGGSAYEHFQLADFRGGDGTSSMAKNDKGVFPMSQYYIQNVEVPMTLYAGASEYAYMSANITGVGIQGTNVPFVGDQGAMFKITDGYVIKDYLEGKGRMLVEAHGNISASTVSMTMQLGILGSTTIDSGKFNLPIANHFTINLVEGEFTINQDLVMYPGAELYIREGTYAKLESGVRVILYDLAQWVGCCGAGNVKYKALPYVPGGDDASEANRLKDALVLLDGTVEAEGAAIYTTAGGANVYSTGTGIVHIAPGTETLTYYASQSQTSWGTQRVEYKGISIQPALLKNADGTFLNTANGESGIMRQYVYTEGKWICDNNHSYGEGVVTAPTCTENGYTTSTCTICGFVKQEIKGDATGHTEVVDKAVAPTCTATGLTEGKHCSACNEVIIAQTVIPATGHTEVVDAAVAPTCTATGLTEGKHCSECNTVIVAQKEISALGHTEVIDAAVPATCIATGLTEGKHCSVCNTVIAAQTVISATGHTAVTDEAVDATCTSTGLTEGSHCSVCNEVLTAQTKIDALGHTEVVDKAVAPTCTTTGLTEGKHCSVCNAVLTAQTKIDALGHTEVVDKAVAPTLNETGLTEGTHCSVCNEALTAQTEIPALLRDIWQNMTLSGDLIFNLHIEADDSVKVSVTFGEETTEYATGTVSVKVAAAQMADSITLTITNPNNAEDKVERMYSVAAYAELILKDEKQEDYHTLVRAMLNYGAAAQRYFGYNTDNIVNETECAVEISQPEKEMKVDVTNEKIRFYGASLVYREKIAVRFYFTGDAEGIVFTANEKEYTAAKKNGLWCVEINDIMPQDLGNRIELTADDVTVAYGPMNYIWRMSQKDDTKLQNLMKALYNYHLAASKLGE